MMTDAQPQTAPQPTPLPPPDVQTQPVAPVKPPAPTSASQSPAAQTAPQPKQSQTERLKNADSNAASPDPSKKDATLNTSVRDAYALLDFSTRRGMEIPAHISTTIVRANDKVLAGEKMPINDQTQFWAAFREIIDLVQPITVESILFSAPKTDATPPQTWREWLFQPHSPADRVLKRYLFMSLASLLLLLGLQIEWAIGIGTYNDAYKVHSYLTNTTNMLEDARLKANAQVTPTRDGATSDTLVLNTQNDIEKLERRQKIDQSWDDVSYVRLWWWNRQFAQMIPPYDLSLSEKGPKFQAGDVLLDQEGKRRIEFTRAELTLEIISNYVLVTLFALLGAMTQALRSLANQIRTVSLTQTKLYSIRTRIILGVISGVCMAWLVINSDANAGGEASVLNATPLDAISFLGAFTPWAVAFVSGYSVEIFFTALERAIRTITKFISSTENQSQMPAKLSNVPKPAPAQPKGPTGTETGEPMSS